MKSVSRRSLLSFAATAAIAVPLLSSCASTTVGTTTIITIDVPKILSYTSAGLSAASTIETALLLIPSLSGYIAPLQAATVALQTAVTAFSEDAKDKLVISYNDATFKTTIDSILSALQQISTQIATIVSAVAAKMISLGLSQAVVNEITLINSSLQTIVSLFRALLVSSTALNSTNTKPMLAMSEAQALWNLREAPKQMANNFDSATFEYLDKQILNGLKIPSQFFA